MRIGLEHSRKQLVCIWEGTYCLKFQHPELPPTIVNVDSDDNCVYLPKWITY